MCAHLPIYGAFAQYVLRQLQAKFFNDFGRNLVTHSLPGDPKSWLGGDMKSLGVSAEKELGVSKTSGRATMYAFLLTDTLAPESAKPQCQALLPEGFGRDCELSGQHFNL